MHAISSVHEYYVTIQERILQCIYSVQGGGGERHVKMAPSLPHNSITAHISTTSHTGTISPDCTISPHLHYLPTPVLSPHVLHFSNAHLLTFRSGKIDTAKTHHAYKLCIYFICFVRYCTTTAIKNTEVSSTLSAIHRM